MGIVDYVSHLFGFAGISKAKKKPAKKSTKKKKKNNTKNNTNTTNNNNGNGIRYRMNTSTCSFDSNKQQWKCVREQASTVNDPNTLFNYSYNIKKNTKK